MPVLLVWLGEAIIGAIGWLLKNKLGQWIASSLIWLGISYGTQKLVIGPALDQIRGYMTGFSGDLLQWLGLLQFDRAVTMILGAMATKAGLAAAKVFLAKRV